MIEHHKEWWNNIKRSVKTLRVMKQHKKVVEQHKECWNNIKNVGTTLEPWKNIKKEGTA